MARKTAVKATETVAEKATTFTTEVRNMSITFEETDYVAPIRDNLKPREKAVNVYEVGIKRGIELMTSAPTKQLTVKVPTDKLKLHVGWIRRGVNDAGFSSNITTAENSDGTTSVSFRVVKRVTRPRKATADAPAAS